MQPENVGPAHPTSPFDHLPVMADGRKVGDVATPELTARFAVLGIPGFKHDAGRGSNIEAYAAEHERRHGEAGRAAIQQWLQAIT